METPCSLRARVGLGVVLSDTLIASSPDGSGPPVFRSSGGPGPGTAVAVPGQVTLFGFSPGRPPGIPGRRRPPRRP
ncbi:hypothetical protein GCM10023221_34350 [Luteimicrobium xylanilyticum]